VPHARVETAIDEELKRFIAKGPTEAELARARTSIRAGFVKGLERIGGFGGKADVLVVSATPQEALRRELQAEQLAKSALNAALAKEEQGQRRHRGPWGRNGNVS
jgi:predicted Zn-dependent peptidase